MAGFHTKTFLKHVFGSCKEIMPRLKELDKPFILILPSSKINTYYIYIDGRISHKDIFKT